MPAGRVRTGCVEVSRVSYTLTIDGRTPLIYPPSNSSSGSSLSTKLLEYAISLE
jgi:hypothetical protein